jgi:hypothetical protein
LGARQAKKTPPYGLLQGAPTQAQALQTERIEKSMRAAHDKYLRDFEIRQARSAAKLSATSWPPKTQARPSCNGWQPRHRCSALLPFMGGTLQRSARAGAAEIQRTSENAPCWPDLERVLCSPPQHGRRAARHVLSWSGTLRGRPPTPVIQNISGLPQGLAGCPPAGWGCGRLSARVSRRADSA